MQPEMTQPNRFIQLVRYFFLGRRDKMDLPALRWWNHQRVPYNLRLVGCLLVGQVLLLSSGYSEGLLSVEELLHGMGVWLYSDLILILVMNLFYFFMPWLEVAVFKGRPERFRTYSFAFINTVSALFVAFSLFAVGVMK